MICADEAQEDIAATLGVKPARVSTPTWSGRLYSCNYEYADGVISLSVKELSDAGATTGYFEGLAKDLGQPPGGISLGEGAFATPTQIVVRKDFMVLDVNVSDLPPQFGQPARPIGCEAGSRPDLVGMLAVIHGEGRAARMFQASSGTPKMRFAAPPIPIPSAAPQRTSSGLCAPT